MSNFLIAAYSLTIKEIYNDIKEKIPGQLIQFEFLKNRTRMIRFTLPSVQKAYREGVDYAKNYINLKAIDKEGKKEINNIKPKISPKAEARIYKHFLTRMKNAEKIYKLRIENLRDLAKLVTKRIDLKNGSQEAQAWNEYVNAVKTATDNLIINAGAEGADQLWLVISKPDNIKEVK